MNKRDYKGATEKLATIASIVYPLSAVPQAIKIYSGHTAAGLSLIAWIGFAFVETIFLIYGITHRLKPIYLGGVLWLILYGFIISGIVIYE